MRYPWANTLLLILLIAQLITGFAGLMNSSEPLNWVLWLHGIGGYGLTVLIYWKGPPFGWLCPDIAAMIGSSGWFIFR